MLTKPELQVKQQASKRSQKRWQGSKQASDPAKQVPAEHVPSREEQILHVSLTQSMKLEPYFMAVSREIIGVTLHVVAHPGPSLLAAPRRPLLCSSHPLPAPFLPHSSLLTDGIFIVAACSFVPGERKARKRKREQGKRRFRVRQIGRE